MDRAELIRELDQVRGAAIAMRDPMKALAATISKAMLLGMMTWEDAQRLFEDGGDLSSANEKRA